MWQLLKPACKVLCSRHNYIRFYLVLLPSEKWFICRLILPRIGLLFSMIPITGSLSSHTMSMILGLYSLSLCAVLIRSITSLLLYNSYDNISLIDWWIETSSLSPGTMLYHSYINWSLIPKHAMVNARTDMKEYLNI